ncbi:MAG: SCP2 sterol-binding domain-containing protein [Bacteroidia bacterium]|nr:SCP2 sterol-binding domain-containing protein [Bacteroidia bacterium]
MLIDDKHYLPPTQQAQTQDSDSLVQELITLLKERARGVNLDSSLKFDFGAHKLLIDGTAGTPTISEEDKEAACTILISPSDMKALLSGELNPMNAFLSGKIKVQGDMSVAMKLQKLFS